MTFNHATLDKYLMAGFIGLLMIAAGLSSTDKWWAVIGAIILGLTLIFAAIDIFGWIKPPSRRREAPEPPPSKLRVALMLPVCLLLAAGLIWLGGTEGIVMAVLLVLSYAALVFLTFLPGSPAKLFAFTMSAPVASGSGDTQKLHDVIRANPDNAEEAAKQHLADHPIVPDSGLWRALDAVSGGRLSQSLEDAGKAVTIEQTPDGIVIRRDTEVDLGSANEAMVDAVFSTIGRGAAQPAAPAKPAAAPTAESFLAQGDDLRSRGQEAEARAAYEKAEAHAIVDWANGEVRHRGVLPTLLVRLGKLDAARSLLAEALSQTPDDESLLSAKALLDRETNQVG